MNQQAKFNLVTEKTLVVGVDIAKNKHWARCHNFRGESISKPIPFQNNKFGFRSLVHQLEKHCKNAGFNNIIIGMEPTGHYWKCLAYYLENTSIKFVLVNPSHVKRSKEFDDNSPTKNDRKDASVIAKLVKDARFFVPQLPKDIYADLRNFVNQRDKIVKKITRTTLQLHTLIDIYFPEFFTVFKKIDGKTALATLRGFPLPSDIIKLNEEEIKTYWRQYNKSSSITMKLINKIKQTAKESIGLNTGISSARLNFRLLMEEYDFHQKQLASIDELIKELLNEIEYVPNLLSIKGIGNLSLAILLSETGDLRNYKHWKQLRKLAGLNLVEKSSGEKNSLFRISKRGRRKLRSILFLMALSLSAKNDEFKLLHNQFKTREIKPLAGIQSLIAITSKLLRTIHTLARKGYNYDPSKLIRLNAA